MSPLTLLDQGGLKYFENFAHDLPFLWRRAAVVGMLLSLIMNGQIIYDGCDDILCPTAGIRSQYRARPSRTARLMGSEERK
jgi:hypothetical protein